MNILAKTYIEKGFVPPKQIKLSEKEYAKALRALVIACADVVAVNKKEKCIYLACRRARPVRGIWWFGGRIFPGEKGASAAVRCLKREAGLNIRPKRLTLIASIDYLFKDREQKPQDIGCHTRSHIYAFEPSAKEITRAARHLNPKEYEKDFGLKPFDYKELTRAKASPIIIDLYKEIFKKSE